MQILNIVVPETRILASRERCPYLVRLEVVETGLDGSDARLYTGGAPRLGLTIEEALAMESSLNDTTNERKHQRCEIPAELQSAGGNVTAGANTRDLPRGGWQAESGEADYIEGNTYDTVLEQQYEQLHQNMQNALPVPHASRAINANR